MHKLVKNQDPATPLSERCKRAAGYFDDRPQLIRRQEGTIDLYYICGELAERVERLERQLAQQGQAQGQKQPEKGTSDGGKVPEAVQGIPEQERALSSPYRGGAEPTVGATTATTSVQEGQGGLKVTDKGPEYLNYPLEGQRKEGDPDDKHVKTTGEALEARAKRAQEDAQTEAQKQPEPRRPEGPKDEPKKGERDPNGLPETKEQPANPAITQTSSSPPSAPPTAHALVPPMPALTVDGDRKSTKEQKEERDK